MKSKNYFFLKRHGMSFVMMFLFLAGSAFVRADVTEGLVVRYTFDNDEGQSITDEMGVAHASIVGSGEISPDGKSGKALYLPTENTPAMDYAILPTGIVSGLADFTIAIWVKPNNIKTWARIFDFGTGQDINMFLTVSAGSTPRFALKNLNPETGNTYVEQLVNSSVPLIPGEWAQITIIGDYTASTVTMYINGAQVGQNTKVTFTPSAMGETAANYLGKAQYNDPGYNGYLDDFRIYNRALSRTEMMSLLGISSSVVNAFDGFSMNSILGGNPSFSDLAYDLTLPTSIGGVTLTWTSSNENAISNTGKITQQSAPQTATLTVTFSQEGSQPLSKSVNVVVAASEPLPPLIAKWQFNSENIFTDESGELCVMSEEDEDGHNNGIRYTATFKDVAKIRIIGEKGSQFNVLDLGNSKGYLDLGTEFGKAVYNLANYAVGGYFRIDETSPQYTANGNFLFSFANSEDAATDSIGYLFMRPYASVLSISTNRWDKGEQHTSLDAHFANNNNSYLGTWHHMFYVQDGQTGIMYVDGEEIAKNEAMTLLPVGIKRPGFEGTPFNWIGRACFASDSWLRNALVYDFRLYSMSITKGDIQTALIDVKNTLPALNAAYAANPNFQDTELLTVQEELTLGDLSNVTGNITLPTTIPGHSSVSIKWSTSDDFIIAANGQLVNKPFLSDVDIILTAELMKNGQKVTKDFTATVKSTNEPFQNDLLVQYDFSQVDGNTVTDLAEKHFKGTLYNDASIRTLITEDNENLNVLDLGNGTGYFDMGRKVGQIMYNTSDYTVSAYVRIDPSYTELNKDGNFIWTFANANNGDASYIIAPLKTNNNQRVEMYPNDWNRVQRVYAGYDAIEQGVWKHFAYTQEGDLGTLYIDGQIVPSGTAIINNVESIVGSGTITNTPQSMLPIIGRSGTIYNWIGRSNWTADVYLRQSMVYDFRLYRKALYDSDFTGAIMNVPATLEKLNNASVGILIPKSKSGSPYNAYFSNKKLVIEGLSGNEKIELYDITGRRQAMVGNQPVAINPGIYIVKIDNYAMKALVK